MLTLTAYEDFSQTSNQFDGTADAIEQLQYGFFGEIGGILSAVKKASREMGAKEKDAVLEELGDALWYLTTIGVEWNFRLEDIGKVALADLQARLGVHNNRASKPVTFSEFDGLIALCHGKLPDTKNDLLRKLAGTTGKLFSESGRHNRPIGLLAELLADIVMAASIFSLPLETIAQENLIKIESRWPRGTPKYVDLFDSTMPPYEQLPRSLEVNFIERELSGKKFVIQRISGVNIGSRLTDNRTSPDGYRFHDVFHLAYMAHLGWSPVTRALLKYKRKSDTNKDENEDGARAIIIEEGIATWIFNHAADRNYYENVKEGKLEYALLKQVRDMVNGYEVEKCPLWQWERAILDGFKVFRELRDAMEGVVHVDLNEHRIWFSKVESPKSEKSNPIQSR